MKKQFKIILLLFSLFIVSLTPTMAQDTISCETDVVVQKGDTISKIAGREYGDVLAFPKIVEATNAMAANDNSYATIADANAVEIGWKLCISITNQPEPAATQTTPAVASNSSPIIKVTFLQMNDVYEINPVSNGTQGGLARVATVRNQLLKDNPNTYTVLAGDLFSPSALGTAKVDGERLAGKQIVAVANALGLDYATFGNHEFDLKEKQFLQRLSESETQWLSGNVSDVNSNPFPGVTENEIITVTGDNGQEVRIGLIGVTMTKNEKDWITYKDPIETAQQQVDALKGEVDIIIAITHIPLADDMKIAESIPEIDLILGGHEHENVQVWRGTDFTPILKADANARSVYIHQLNYNTENGTLEINSALQLITDKIKDDPAVAKVIAEWEKMAFAGFEASGFQPKDVVVESTVALDGLEATVRNHPTNLTDLIANGIMAAAPDTELAIFNGGAIRIDDIIPPGNITEYDVIRILPFGGSILSVEMTGSLLQKVIEQGVENKGTGGYLQTANIEQSKDGWLIAGEPLDTGKSYKVAVNDFLVSGFEHNLDYLNFDNPDLTKLGEHGDIRISLINQLKATFK